MSKIVDVTQMIQGYNPTGANPEEINANSQTYLDDIKRISDNNISILKEQKDAEINNINTESKNAIIEQQKLIDKLAQDRIDTTNSINTKKVDEIAQNNAYKEFEIQKLTDQTNKEIAQKQEEAAAIKLKAREDLRIANENLEKAIKDIEKLNLDKENAIKEANDQELLLRKEYEKQNLDLSLNIELNKNAALEESKKISNDQFAELSKNANLILKDIENQTIEEFYNIGGVISAGVKGASDLGIPIPKKSYIPETYAKTTYGRGAGEIPFNIRLRPYKPGFGPSKF
jgi:hypothetical protein